MKPKETQAPLPLFYAYAREDEILRDKLEVHLKQLNRDGLISGWHDRQILPGETWEREIDDHLEAASLILLLVSPDFLASDYCYEIEMQRALERDRRGEARVVPIILRPCDWQHAPFAHLQVLPKNGKAISTWSNEDEALLDVAQGLRKLLERNRPPVHTLPRDQVENRKRVIKRVRTTWIDGLLAQALQQGPWLDIELQEQPDALENPWSELVQELDATPRPLPPGTTIEQVYDQADGRLLLLGKPGAGKTVQLLVLTRTLLERAEQDTRQPLPVVFVLSSWARKRQPLGDWLVEELKVRYQISHAIAARLVKERHILPLLDGLDEVAPQVREACLQAINTYIQVDLEPKNIPLVLSCRYDDYMRLPTRASLQKAVSVLPLSDGQVEQYLRQGGRRVEALRQAFRADSNLAEMARTPLLLNIFMLTYMDSPLADLPLGLSQVEALPILFSNYVRRMLNRRGLLRSTNKKLALAWLTFLAKQMSHYNQTVFSIETLQTDGMTMRQERFYRISYALQVSLLFFLAIGPLFALANILAKVIGARYSPGYYVNLNYLIETGINNGLGLGLLAAGCALVVILLNASLMSTVVPPQVRRKLTPSISENNTVSWGIRPREILTWDWSWKNFRFGLIWGFLTGPCIGFLVIPSVLLVFFCIILLVATTPFWLNPLNKWRSSQAGKQFLERFKNWPWRTIRLVLFCCFVVLVLSLEIASAFIPSLNPASLTIAVTIGVPVWLMASILKIASGERVMQRVNFRPNEGIKRSGRNGLIIWLAIAWGLILSLGIGNWLFFRTPMSLVVFPILIGAPVGLSLGLFFGLSAYLRHFTLRFWLWRLKYLPWNLAGFLDEMAERIFLRRVGGSYLFIHRFLLDYFAVLTADQQETLVATTQAGGSARRV